MRSRQMIFRRSQFSQGGAGGVVSVQQRGKSDSKCPQDFFTSRDLRVEAIAVGPLGSVRDCEATLHRLHYSASRY